MRYGPPTPTWQQSGQHGKYVELWSNPDGDDLQVHLTGKPENQELRHVESLLHRMGYAKGESTYDLDRNRFIDTYRRGEPDDPGNLMVGS